MTIKKTILSKEIMITLSRHHINNQVYGLPPELVKDFSIELYKDEQIVYTEDIINNYLRFRIHKINKSVDCNRIKILVSRTYGDKHARIFEIRVY